jgi:hypothetical protein
MEAFNTFWEIIKNQGIEIPPIQRDYAQGRNSEKVENIRTKFINSLHEALNENVPLRLDFIYGKIYGIRNEEEHRRNKQAINSLLKSVKDYANTIDLTFNELDIRDKSPNKQDLVFLVPLDGQQRLTTLFLLHWYFAKRLKLNEEIKVLKRFKYKTRKSSLSFINLLCSDANIEFKKPLDEEIVKLENFSNTWLDDPTVYSMLVVLNTLHSKFGIESDEKIAEYWQRLTEGKKVFFDFLNLKDFNLSDELYVKMNARGKQLSEFENFKAWLFGELEKNDLIDPKKLDEYKRQFDVEWNDIFWNIKHKSDFEIDVPYFNYFKLMLLYDTMHSVNLNGTNFEESNKSSFISAIQSNKSINFETEFKDLHNIEKHFRILEVCSEFNSNSSILTDFYQFYFSKSGIAPSWNSIIKHYFLLSYISNKNVPLIVYSEDDWLKIKEYVRIMNNLFRNSIIDNPSLYKNAISQIDEITTFLSENNFEMSKWIESLEYNSKSVFPKHQIEEEILKFRLLNGNEKWKELIYEAESINYFEGQLNFWFYKCDMNMSKGNFSEDFYQNMYIDKFKEVTSRISKLFKESGINREDSFSERIFERALLSKSDYLLREGGYKCFGRNTGRDVSWKRFFIRDRNNEEANSALKEIFNLDFDNPKISFQEYIETNKQNYFGQNWRKAFIENKELFNYLGNQKYVRNIENHGWVLIKDGYKTYIGAHYELFSLDFHLKYLKDREKEFSPFTNTDYYPAPKNNLDDIPCAFLNWETKNFIFALDVRFLNEKFNLRFFSRNIELTQDVQQILLNLNFIKFNDDYIIEIENELDTISLIKDIAKQFSEL